jgi:hypothetical protein
VKPRAVWGMLGDGRFALTAEEKPGVWVAFARLRTLVDWCDASDVELINRDQADEALQGELELELADEGARG